MAISGPGKVGIIVEDITFSDFCMIFVYVCQVSAELPKRFSSLPLFYLFYLFSLLFLNSSFLLSTIVMYC